MSTQSNYFYVAAWFFGCASFISCHADRHLTDNKMKRQTHSWAMVRHGRTHILACICCRYGAFCPFPHTMRFLFCLRLFFFFLLLYRVCQPEPTICRIIGSGSNEGLGANDKYNGCERDRKRNQELTGLDDRGGRCGLSASISLCVCMVWCRNCQACSHKHPSHRYPSYLLN